MTVAASVKTYVGPFVGDNTTTTFAVNFPLWEKGQVAVWRYLPSAPADAMLLEPDIDYTVSGVGSQESPSMSGSVVLTTALDSDHEILITSDYDIDQLIDLVSQARFFPQTHESAWDYRTMLIKQFTVMLSRFIDFEPPTVAPVIHASGIIINGKDLAEFLATMEELLAQAQAAADSLSYVDPKMWSFVGDGAQTVFYLPEADVADPRLYMVVSSAGDTSKPDNPAATEVNDYDIHIDEVSTDSYIKIYTAPADQAKFWVLCLGFPRPVMDNIINDPTFITLVQNTIQQILAGGTTVTNLGAVRSLVPTENVTVSKTVDGSSEASLLRSTSATAVTLSIWGNDGNSTRDWKGTATASPYFSVVQRGAGQVTVAGAPGVTILVPTGYVAKTRAQGSVITLTGDGLPTGQWLCSGDMAHSV